MIPRCPKCQVRFNRWRLLKEHLSLTGHTDTSSMKGVQKRCMLKNQKHKEEQDMKVEEEAAEDKKK